MSQLMQQPHKNENDTSKQATPKKKKYQSPAWEVEEIFERTALTCAKADGDQCGAGPIQS